MGIWKVMAMALLCASIGLGITGCGAQAPSEAPSKSPEAVAQSKRVQSTDMRAALRMTVDGAEVSAVWEDNASVETLAGHAGEGAIEVELHQYGGFEQVGPLPWSLPTDDSQMTTTPGDIVLYQGDQISLMSGSNTWSYTRLGHIEGLTESELAELLGGDAVILALITDSV